VWDSKLEKSATEYSKKLGKRFGKKCGRLEHSKGRSVVGENLFSILSGGNTPTGVARIASEAWYNEVKDYKFAGGQKHFIECKDFAGPVGHLTQVMWEKSRKIGCGGYDCKARKDTYVYTCHYSPGGNVVGRPVFANENFMKLCKNEPGKWKSCDKGLQKQCDKMAKNAGNSFLLTERISPKDALMISCLAIITLYIIIQ